MKHALLGLVVTLVAMAQAEACKLLSEDKKQEIEISVSVAHQVILQNDLYEQLQPGDQVSAKIRNVETGRIVDGGIFTSGYLTDDEAGNRHLNAFHLMPSGLKTVLEVYNNHETGVDVYFHFDSFEIDYGGSVLEKPGQWVRFHDHGQTSLAEACSEILW
jgi:hypothetical protein